MKTLIKNGTVINEGKRFAADIIIDNDHIQSIVNAGEAPRDDYNNEVDATGCLVLPGVIDAHVHFREPGLTHKADIESESRAAAYGGVTTYFDMPNTVPQTTSIEALDDKFSLAASKSHVNYSFFFGATNDNVDDFARLDVHRIPGIKLFMGSSTGNMLVDKDDSLCRIFSTAASLGLPVMTHCEDTDIINANMAAAKEKYGDDPDVTQHPLIRSVEACYESTSKAVELARKFNAHLHVAHLTTAKELELFPLEGITAEATVAHLMFDDSDYIEKGTRIKCNPAVKSRADRDALRKALTDGRVATIGTDHAPHALAEKKGGAAKAVSGMPMLQFSLVSMLSLVDEGVLSAEKMVELMSHNPARLFSVRDRGFIRPGYKADLVIVSDSESWTLTADKIQGKCGWSPLEGTTFRWSVRHTFCNGNHILCNGVFDASSQGEEVLFR